MRGNGKIVAIRTLMLFALVTVCMMSLKYSMVDVKADNVYDYAVDWEPLQVRDVEVNTFYRITLTESQKIHFRTTSFTNYNFYDVWSNVTIYKPDGSIVNSDDNQWYSLKAGTYYAQFDTYDHEGIWYELSNITSKNDLSKDVNIAGTVFEGYTTWSPMTTISDTDDNKWKVVKIVLNERSRIEFRCDRCGENLMADPYFLYDSYGRTIEGFHSMKNRSYEWDAGTYFLRLFYTYQNLYYVRSAPQNATNISISKSNISLSVGETSKLTYKIEPANCVDTVTWKSTDTSVATIKNNGIITAVSPGKCVVQATTGSGKAALCEVTVRKSNKATSKKAVITVKKGNKKISSVSIKKGKKVILKVTTSSKAKLSFEKLTKKQKKIVSVTFNNGKMTIKGKKKGMTSLKITSAKTPKYQKASKTVKITVK